MIFLFCSDHKFQEKLNYVHNNPLKAGLVIDPADHLWSSWKNYYIEDNSLIEMDYLKDLSDEIEE